MCVNMCVCNMCVCKKLLPIVLILNKNIKISTFCTCYIAVDIYHINLS